LYKRLSTHPNAFELDESSFDASLFREAMEGQRNIRWELLHPSEKIPENKKILWNLYDQIIHSVIVLDNGQVFQKHTGNPSGSANTIVDNTMILFRLFAYSWIVNARSKPSLHQYMTYGAFMKNVEAALNGDDNTFTVSNECVGWFNPTAIAAVWSGIGVTTETPCWEPRKVEEVKFLSQSFVMLDGVWLPKPERDKVLCSLLWGSEFIDTKWTLMRCYALRLESWADEQLREELASLIDHIRRNYAFELQGIVAGTQISMKDIDSVYKTDAEIWRLYAFPPLEPLGQAVCYEPLERYLQKGTDQICFVDGQNQYVVVKLQSYSFKIECDQPEGEILPVPDDYKSPKVAKWRGKGLGSRGFDFKTDNIVMCQKCGNDELYNCWGRGPWRCLNCDGPCDKSHVSPSETEMYIADEMPKGSSKRQRAAPQGKPKRKQANRAPQRNGKSRKSRGNAGGMGPQYSAPVSTGRIMTNVMPRATRISHRESLGPVTSTGTGFTVLFNLPVNPAQSGSFPWLSNIAQQYETYSPRKGKKKGKRLHAIRYLYTPSCSTATAGTVCMATNYDATEAAFSSLVQMENYRGASRCSTWEEMSHDLEVDAMRDYNRHYCRPGAAPASTDIKTYDVGNFQLAVSGVAAGQIGELFVEYDIDLFDPRVQVPIGQSLPMAHIVSGAAGTATAAAPLGSTAAVIRAGSNIPGLTAAGVTLTIPPVGRYLVASIYASGTISTSPTLAAGANAANALIMTNSTTNGQVAVTANTAGIAVSIFDVTAPNGVITMGGGGTYTAGNTDVFICQLSSGLTKPHAVEIEEIHRLYAMLIGDRKDEKAHGDGQLRRLHQMISVDQNESDDEKGYTRVASVSLIAPTTAAAATAAGVPVKVPSRK